MSICYSLISRGATVLVDYAECSGNFREISMAILHKVEVDKNSMCSFSSDEYLFHLIIDDGLIYLCMADKEMGKLTPYNYLHEIKTRFKSGSLKERALHCGPYELKRDFAAVLAQQLKRFNKGEDIVDNVKILRNNVKEVNTIMTQNIDKILERGERLDVLSEKADEMSRSSESFGIVSRRLKNKSWWQNKKMCMILSVLGFVVLGVIVIIVLYEEKVL